MDAYTVALLHFTGADASTTFRDESGKTWTAAGNAQIDTAVTSPLNNGGSTGLFDGTGDYIYSADSADWQLDGGSNSNTWTIDFWVRFNADPSSGDQGIISQFVDVSNYWGVQQLSTDNLNFVIRSGGVTVADIQNAWNPTTNTWYHVAIVKNGTTGYLMFVDGSQIGTTQTDTDTIPNLAANLNIGLYTKASGTAVYTNGWLEELRISKGVARWTANFTPPKLEYTAGSFLAMF